MSTKGVTVTHRERQWLMVAAALLGLSVVTTVLGFTQGDPLWFLASAALSATAAGIAYRLDHA